MIEEKNSKTVLVLPGTIWQMALVEKIKTMGHRVLVVNPAPDSPCFAISDGHLQSDIFDKVNVVEYGRKNHIDAVLSDECDIAMNLVAELGKEFGVSTLSEDAASLFTDKFLMREFSKKNGLKYPEYRYCRDVDDAISFLNEINRPIIIKPLDSNASHGVFKVESEIELKHLFPESMKFSRHEKCVLAERYIEGTEFTIDGVKTPSAHYTVAISEKKHFKHNQSIANELLFSNHNSNYDYDKLRRVNDEFVMRSPLKFGFTHAEYKCENGEFYLIEIAARGGGNMISSVIAQHMSGYDTYKYLIECSLGYIRDQDFSPKPEYQDRAAVLKFFTTPGNGGKVTAVKGLDYLESEPDIVKYKLNFGIGDTIQNATNDSARIGFYIVCSDNMQKLQKVVNSVDDKFEIIY